MLDGFLLGIIGIYLGSLDGSFDGSDDGKLEELFLGVSLGYTNCKALGYDEGIKLGSTDGKLIGTILGNLDGITLGLDIGTYLGFLDGSFGGSNDGNLEGFFLGDSLVSNDGKVLGSDEGTARAGLTWSGVHGVVVGWMFCSVGCHATSKGAELICELDYAISF